MLSHLTALLCNLIVPELHQFPEQSIPLLAGCRQPCPGPLRSLQNELQSSRPPNQNARRHLCWPDGPWLQTCVPSWIFFLLLLFVVSLLTGCVSLCSSESQDVVRL